MRRSPKKVGDRDCRFCDGSGYTTKMVRSPGSPDGCREEEHECSCATEPDCDGPPDEEDRSTGNEECEW